MYIPWPRAWMAQMTRRGRIFLGFALLFIFCVWISLVAVSRGAYPMLALPALLVSLSVVGIGVTQHAVFGARNRGSGAVWTGNVRGGHDVTLLLRLPALNVWNSMAMVVLFVFLLSMPWFAELFPNDGSLRGTAFHAVAPFAPVAAGYPAAVLLSRLVRKRGELGIGLSPEGVYHWTYFGCCFFSWDWITAVGTANHRTLLVKLDVAESSKRPVIDEETWFGRIDLFRSGATRIMVGYLAVNPAVAYLALAFYQRHPELRSELGTQASVERIQRMDFPELVKEIEQYGDLRTPESTRD